MSDLAFAITGAKPKPHTAVPLIAFGVQIAAPGAIAAMVLRVQVRIEPQLRAYDGEERTLLNDLFGTPERWTTTLRTFPWADIPLAVTAFSQGTNVELNVPATYDFDVAATRYASALNGGELPLRMLFSGAVFRDEPQSFTTERVPWSCEAAYRLPVAVWRDAMRECYGDDALIRVHRETLDKLNRYRSLSGVTTWDALFERLLRAPAP